jgi:CDP-paratose 2-epimerase
MTAPLRLAPVLITGGAGFIGTNLADQLLRRARRVRIYDNLSRSGAVENLNWLRARYGALFEFHHADIRATEGIRAALAEVETVFHLAAQVAVTTSLADPCEDFEVNALGTLNLLEAIRDQGRSISLIFTSTNKVYGALDDLELVPAATRYRPLRAKAGIDETWPLSFRSPYGCSKGAADQYVIDYARSYGCAAVVFRMSCVYGPHQHGTEDQGWVAHFLIRANEGLPITVFGDGRQVRDLLHVEDLTEAFLSAEKHLPDIAGKAFNLGGGAANALSLRELIDYIALLNGSRPKIIYDAWRTGDQRWYVSDFAKFTGATGWRPRIGWKQGVRDLRAWLSPGLSSAAVAGVAAQ